MLNVIVIGLGPIGLAAAKAVREDRKMKLVGVVDVDPEKVGQRIDDLPKVSADVSETLKKKPQVAIVCTTSYFDQLAPTLRQCIKHGIHVVSSCEEMAWPKFLHARLAAALDKEAKKKKVALLGTGVNPGFVMDLLPAVLSSMVTKVDGVRVTRRLDAALRRQPLQAKVGATMTPDQFNDLAKQGKIGHKGIGESVALLAAALSREAKPSAVHITLTPVIAERELDSLLGPIHPGQVCGMRNTARFHDGEFHIELDLTMAVGAEEPEDRIDLLGPVPLTAIIPNSTPGDTATVAALVNCARILPSFSPGLKTMLDIPPASCKRE